MSDALIQHPPLELTWVGYGEIVHASNVDAREPHFVMHNCEAPAPGFFCETCDRHLANRGQLEMHLEKGGRHHVAVYCPKHRVYEEACG